MNYSDLINEFEASASILRSAGWEAGASIWEQAAKRLEEFDREREEELLTIEEAIAFSGYSRDQLLRYLAEGRLINYGDSSRKNGGPKFRRGDLPKKISPRSTPDRETPEEIAARVKGKLNSA